LRAACPFRLRARSSRSAYEPRTATNSSTWSHSKARRRGNGARGRSTKSIAALGAGHSLSKALGLRSLHSEWIPGSGPPAGIVFLASRTDRQLTDKGRRLLAEICPLLGERLDGIDRREQALLDVSLRIAREAVLLPEGPVGEFDTLRPRERLIVTQYAEGLSVEEIAQLLVISPHTVRTHVKNAFRRLGVHSREEAARLLFADEVRRLL
jgi:DNA-binding CsgD family transcriptional regulator